MYVIFKHFETKIYRFHKNQVHVATESSDYNKSIYIVNELVLMILK